MAVLGVGTDIIEIERIRKSIARYGYRFINRLFTSEEQEYCLNYRDSAPRFAARFAGKEAVVKALGTGFGKQVGWRDIAILNASQGRPEIHLSLSLARHFDHPQLLISISHSALYASAVAIWQES